MSRLPSQLFDPVRLSVGPGVGLPDTAPDEAFDRLTRLASLLLHAPFAFVTLVEERLTSGIGVTATDPADRQNQVEDSFSQYVVASGEPLFVSDTGAAPLTARLPAFGAIAVAAWAGFPVRSSGGQVLGAFCVLDTAVREWTDRDIEILQTLSAAAGGELALRETAAEAQTAVAARDAANTRLTLLAEVGDALSQTLDTEEAVARLATMAVPLLGDWSIVSVVETDGTLRDLASWHVDPALRPVVELYAATRFDDRDEQGPMQQAQRSTKPVVTTDVTARALSALRSPQAVAAIVELAPLTSVALPLMAHGQVVGVLSVCRGADRPPMTPEEIAVAGAVAHRAGMALDNARLYTEQRTLTRRLHEANHQLRTIAVHEHTVARTLQDALLTRLPEPADLQLAARYLTASGSEQVGGDWYDAVLQPSGDTTLVIGDVIGHDVQAAALMGQLRSMLRAFAWDHDEPPSATIARLDRAMRDLQIPTIATVLTARVEHAPDAGGRLLRWSSAGHPPPLLLEADGTVRVLDGGTDILLGVLPDTVRHDHTHPVPPGATLLLYTDGLVETHDRPVADGLERLLESVRIHRDLALPDLLDVVLAAMVGTQPSDDVAVLAARFGTPTRRGH